MHSNRWLCSRTMKATLCRIVILLLGSVFGGALGQVTDHPRSRLWFRYMTFGPCVIVGEEDACSMENVQFNLFTSVNPEDPELVDAVPGYSNITASTFNPANPTKIIVHGYNSGSKIDLLVDIKDAYVAARDYNVFMVEWGELSSAPCYPTAAHNARYVGRCIGELVRAVMNASSSDVIPSDLHIIGFSLGAQVAGFVADFLKPLTIPRITGLDPALPLFLTSNPRRKLDPSDAEFVDVLHTNALVQGQVQATGHLDFYMNGGYSQPGCELESNAIKCNHHRALSYFAESIVSDFGFWGWPCSSWFSYRMGTCTQQKPNQLMGEYADHTVRGVFYVNTDSTPPFALGRDN
ncbi:hypothetical protein B566_EDAN005328 [Ephemera danica]|nr:hypothetical protein B566_EDAN005328 [Ephemera danica]